MDRPPVSENYRIIFTGPGVAELQAAPLPRPQDNELLIRTRVSLISPGTERAFFLGLPNTSRQYPQPSGYSNIGEVVAVGAQVQGWKPGDRVASAAHHAAYVTVEAAKCLHVPDALPDEPACFFNLTSIALQGIRKARVELGEAVAVVGAGLIGLLAVQLARLQGALPAVSIDQDPQRLEFADAIGVDAALVAGDDLAPRLAELCDGEGAAVVVEATGHPDAILTALTLARPFGRVVLLGSTRGETDHVNFYRDVHKKGLTLIGAHDSARPRLESTHGWWTQHDDRRIALQLLARRRLQVEPLITDRFAWQDALMAYETLQSWSHTALGLLLDWTR
ncbi:MAG TPA: zinc-binding alcohol dehydrogenase [Caldilineaceae bacterium]|nr:zinc-binding alcohol dehydrogenase [Caldilineaceae bacterium]